MYLDKSLSFLRNKIIPVYNSGVEIEKDESKQKYLILVNVAATNSAFVTFVIGLLWIFFTPDLLIGLSSIIFGFILLVPVYLNSKGRALAAKKFMVLSTNNILLISACIFSHHGKLENYYYSIIVAFSFIFSYEERKWAYLSVFITLIYYSVEVTPLHNFLPDYNLVKDLHKSTSINNFGSIMMTLLELVPFFYMTRQWQIQLMEHQKILEDTKHQLQVQNEDLETFSIAASHSLQTPIHITKFFFNRMKDEPGLQEYLSRNLKVLNIVDDSLNQMDRLVNGLFLYSNIIKIDEEYSSFKVSDELIYIKRRLEEEFNNCKILIVTKGLSINTNRMLFSIIIQNLVENGLKYNLSNEPIVKLEAVQNKNGYSFFITDNGIGIARNYFEKIFEPFKRIDSSGKFKGNGLGLSGAKRAAERINGRLFCKESSSEGSIFQLDIPYGKMI